MNRDDARDENKYRERCNSDAPVRARADRFRELENGIDRVRLDRFERVVRIERVAGSRVYVRVRPFGSGGSVIPKRVPLSRSEEKKSVQLSLPRVGASAGNRAAVVGKCDARGSGSHGPFNETFGGKW